MAGALGVVITTDVPMSGQHAQPVYVDDSLPIVGPSQAIVVTTGEVPQMGGPALAVRLAPAGTPALGPALPVYVVSGSLGSSAPAVLAPVDTVLPSISGTVNIGYTLTASTGSWTNSPSGYSYQWKRAGVDIGGATNSTYVLTESDSGAAITVVVTATNAGGSASATSASVTPPSFLILDRFTTNRAAGAVNGTAAEPGGSLAPNRTVVDGSSLLSIASSQLTLGSGGGANNPNLVYTQSVARAAGRALMAKCGTGNLATFIFGWSSGAAGTTNTHRANWNNGLLRWGTGFPNITAQLHNSPYWYVLVLRSTGVFLFLIGADFAYPALIFIDRAVATTPLYASWSLAGVTNGGNMIVDDVAVPTDTIYPTALASDDFTRANGAPGNTNSYDGGSALAWADQLGTSAIASNVLGWSALTGGEGLLTVNGGAADVLVIASLTRSAGIVGVIVRWLNASNYIRVQHDGTNLQIVKVVAGTPTTVATAAVAYSAGADIIAVIERTQIRAFYNNAQLAASASTISDAALQTGTNVGLYSTDTGNTADNFSAWPRGTAAEHATYRSYGVLKQTKPCIVFDGDSLTIGSTVTNLQTYPYQLIDLIGRAAYDYYNVGITGQACADLLTDRTYSYGPLASAGIWSKFIVDLWIGSNDLVASRTAAAIYADITTLVQYYQSLGALVAVNTIIPRTGIGGGNETARLALNVLINANSIGANAVIDLAANVNLQDFNNTTYFNADKTHLTATGYGVVAALQQPIIGAL